MPPSVLTLSADGLSARPRLQDGNVVWFKIMKNAKLKKLMEAYCARQRLQMDQIRFMFDGNRLQDSQTPDELEMGDHDVIHVVPFVCIPAVAEEVLHGGTEVLHGGTQPAIAALGAEFSITIELKLHSLPANGQIAALVRFSPPDFSQVSMCVGASRVRKSGWCNECAMSVESISVERVWKECGICHVCFIMKHTHTYM